MAFRPFSKGLFAVLGTKRPRELEEFTLAWDTATRGLTEPGAITVLPRRPPSQPGGPWVGAWGGSCFAPGSCHPAPGALSPAERPPWSPLPIPRPSWASFYLLVKGAPSPHIGLGGDGDSGHGKRQASLVAPAPAESEPSFAFPAPIWTPPAP